MERSTKELTTRERSMEREGSTGKMALATKGISLRTISKALEHTFGQTKENTQGLGLITRCMARGLSLGQMAGVMKASL
jgi:hypothetical protein